MKKRTLTTILTCIGACMFLAGCGDTASSSGNDTSKGSQELSEESQKISEDPQESSEETKEASADTEKERQRKKLALKKETNEEAAEEKASGDRKGAYQEILYKYKEAQDGQESADTIEISKDMQKKLNIFLSNFAEQGMAEFDYGRPDAGDLADFAYLWTYINKWTDLDITTDGYYTLSLDKVENVVNRFMDITLTDDDLNSYTWPNVYQGFVSKGRYCVRAADGESYDTLAIVTSLSDEGANNYRAQFDIYDLDSTNNEELVSLPPKFYSYNAAEAGSEPNLIKAGSGYAIIRKDGDSYKLKYYDTELLKDGNEIERPGMTGSAEKQISGDPLEGLVASDILAKYRESNPLKSPDSIEKEAFALGDWVQKSIKNIPAATREKGETIGRRYEFWFGTDVGNNFDANFPRIYSAYYSLKDYYTSDGSRSKEFYEGVCEENDFMGNGNPENIEKMYIDMQSFVTDCNNIIRKK